MNGAMTDIASRAITAARPGLGALTVLFAALPAFCLGAENFYGFAQEQQRITAEFASEDAAKQAQILICPLPDDRKIAFTVRGDDTNGGHGKLAQTLAKYGFKAGFYLNDLDSKFVAGAGKDFLAAGSSAGNHTLSHPRLPDLLPNKIFSEIVLHQARIESSLNTCSVSFTLPFTVLDNPADPAGRTYTAEALRRAGILISGDGFDHGLPPEEFFIANRLRWFNGADSNPQPAELEKAYQAAREVALKEPQPRIVAYGTHTQYNAAGLESLEKWLQMHKDDPEIWKCNPNEFAAYHYAAVHAAPQAQPEGKSSVFTLTRFHAADLGAEVPLCVRFSQPPQRVRIEGKEIAVSANGVYTLPATGKIPQRVGWVRGQGEDAKFPGVQVQLKYDEQADRLLLKLENRAAAELTDLNLRFVLPMCWKDGVSQQTVGRLAAGESKEVSVALGARQEARVYSDWDWPFICRLDFLQGETAGRIYVDLTKQRPLPDSDCPRDRVLVVGPVANAELTPQILAQLSQPQNALKDFGEKVSQKWRKYNYHAEGYQEFLANAVWRGAPDKEYGQWNKETQEFFARKTPGSRLLVLDFEAPAAGEAVLFCPSHPTNLSLFYLNGEEKKFGWKNKWNAENECTIPVLAGRNRIVFVNPITSDWLARQFGMTVQVRAKADGAPLRCLPVMR